MARITVLPNGVTASVPRFGPQANLEKRGKVNGWSAQSVARLRRKFFGIDGSALDGVGFTLTLTVRDCPGTAAEWMTAREDLVKRLRRKGLIRLQWLTEWTARKVPHMHGMAYFEDGHDVPALVKGHWQAVAGRWGVRDGGQYVTQVHALPGWLQYQAKHSARGVRHYQRVGVPPSWLEGGTGRLWGFVGPWPVREEVHEVGFPEFHRYRRLLRSWMIAQARDQGDYRRAAYLRGILRDPKRRRSMVRGISEFIPEHVSTELLLNATWGVLDSGNLSETLCV